jgi:hypothetical protein
MIRNQSRPPPMVAVIAAALAICAAVWLLACIFRHSVAFLVGGVVLCVVLKYLKDITA